MWLYKKGSAKLTSGSIHIHLMSSNLRLPSGLAFMPPSTLLDTSSTPSQLVVHGEDSHASALNTTERRSALLDISRTPSQLVVHDEDSHSSALNPTPLHSEVNASFQPAFGVPTSGSFALGSVQVSQPPQTSLRHDHSVVSSRNEWAPLRSLLPSGSGTSERTACVDLPAPILALDPSLPGPSSPSRGRDLGTFLHFIAARFSFSPQTIKILEEFASYSIQEQLVLVLGMMLDSREAHNTPNEIQNWSLTSQLKVRNVRPISGML